MFINNLKLSNFEISINQFEIQDSEKEETMIMLT